MNKLIGIIPSPARKVVRGIVWIVTPWRMKERLPLIRKRLAAWNRRAKLVPLIERERVRVERRKRGLDAEPQAPFNLFDNAEVARAAGLSMGAFHWPAVLAADVSDRWSAARFLIDLWRSRLDLRERFPMGLVEGGNGPLGHWLRGPGAAELGLSEVAIQQVPAVLDARLSDRPRQTFLSNKAFEFVLPHGLTPIGMRDLFGWFMRCFRAGSELRREEIWLLFLEASAQPTRELLLAYAFTPAWQQAHPAGSSMFGRDAFAAWFIQEYGAEGPWVDPSTWPDSMPVADQIRTAYRAIEVWRTAHPDALHEPGAARRLLAWLGSPAAGLPVGVAQRCREFNHEAMAIELAKPGLNVLGHFCYPSGLRVSVESMVQGMEAVGAPTSLRDVWTDLASDDPHHADYRGMECHDVTLIHVQPEPFFALAYERAQLAERSPRTYRVAYWYWEFDTVPDSWVAHAQDVDEIWAATEFVARGLRARLSIPVRTLFPGVKLAPYQRRSRTHFGLSEAPFTFLFTFHMVSVMERKNPLGLIQAFRQAFRAEESVRLVLKTSFGDRHPAQIEELRNAAAGSNITVIDQVYSPDEVLSLMDACDAYVSLHRSEGLGLTMAEAMLMGKPVIATNFSGNVDFMDESNSLLVPYKLAKLGKPIPPYGADLEWAEPSIEEAAKLMRRLYENQEWARELGARAKASAEANLSLPAAGARIASRLEEIQALRRAAP
ncbi:glycosyltransferase family 4 protein [Variovorax sp. J22R115]|uniref:glycosyltransferase family 4 protein n=1 Tax=Variovorax sp. J22R115 TaxID=3053509 RepID=UPI00257909FA|nr:glycosyltransferase family 4 protein [Variovorax sp. J22R115]MDM0049030.1 glycosyltransferase family 4 protein [Variovorax sp. J22R115]